MIDGFDFPIEVIRSDRKRSAAIALEGSIIKVRVPKSLSDSRIQEIITRRAPWIKKKIREALERPVLKAREYVSGETFSYLGKNYRLKVARGEEASIKLRNGYLCVTTTAKDKDPEKTIKSLLTRWYREHAETRLAEKTERLGGVIGVRPNAIKVRDYKARWGSCSSTGDISYNWRIILAPHPIVDYVVVHELCHLLEHNHSAQYWKHVQRYAPDWKDSRAWLKANSEGLFI
jgi:predicted metal-dependent hydrolase